MPKVKRSRKPPPDGWELIEPTLDELDQKMREAETEPHEGKRKVESLWPIFRLHHQRSRYIFDLFYKRKAISRELYEYCIKEGYADKNLIAKWKKQGYENLCCLRCIQTRDTNFGTNCICRVPKGKLEVVECVLSDTSVEKRLWCASTGFEVYARKETNVNFYTRECSNKECPFLHIDPESKIKDCPWYDRGFCKHGPDCRHRHTRRVICVNYLVGFCPEGKSCKFMHPRFELPMGATEQPPLPQQAQSQQKQQNTQPTNRSSQSLIQLTNTNVNSNQRMPNAVGIVHSNNNMGGPRGPRPLDQVTCYKCGEKGHYANKCTKGHLAFLSGQ
ncbi:cleavage and polyadenylation specificity factor subunit 4 [Labeo rohita]|uniref:Cleavage and polyadenylation specificity factor subunit 4 n=1 Tax=Labeo rohita TaxID=84645 RepID=A0A498MA13_LABRO|nr:cleavage and polyadenylation specificity factor subunit 4 [Labeo rohita]